MGWVEIFCQPLIMQCNNYSYIGINIKITPLCSLDKPEKAVRNRWCIKPLPNQRKRALFMEGTLDLPAHPVIVKFQHLP